MNHAKTAENLMGFGNFEEYSLFNKQIEEVYQYLLDCPEREKVLPALLVAKNTNYQEAMRVIVSFSMRYVQDKFQNPDNCVNQRLRMENILVKNYLKAKDKREKIKKKQVEKEKILTSDLVNDLLEFDYNKSKAKPKIRQ